MGDSSGCHARPKSGEAEPLWRELVGAELRTERHARERAALRRRRPSRASRTQYLSEVERGLKDPSSEILAAIAGALDLTVAAARDPRRQAGRPIGARGPPLCLAA